MISKNKMFKIIGTTFFWISVASLILAIIVGSKSNASDYLLFSFAIFALLLIITAGIQWALDDSETIKKRIWSIMQLSAIGILLIIAIVTIISES